MDVIINTHRERVNREGDVASGARVALRRGKIRFTSGERFGVATSRLLRYVLV